MMLGIVGIKFSGKSTAFEVMREEFEAEEVALAEKLKHVCADVFGIKLENFILSKLKEAELEVPVHLSLPLLDLLYKAYNINAIDKSAMLKHTNKILYTPRELLQYCGTEILRAVDTDVHCKVGLQKLVKVQSPHGVITDLRMPNEVKFFRQHIPNFKIIKIQNTKAEYNAKTDTHESERMALNFTDYDAIIENNSDIETFRASVRKTFQELNTGNKRG